MVRNIQLAWSADTVIAVGFGLVVTEGTLELAPTSFNAQTGTSYAIQDSDKGKFITFANAAPVAVSIAQAGTADAFGAGWYCDILTTGAGTVTVTPAVSTINGAATLVRTTGQGARIISDGTNYLAQLSG